MKKKGIVERKRMIKSIRKKNTDKRGVQMRGTEKFVRNREVTLRGGKIKGDVGTL